MPIEQPSIPVKTYRFYFLSQNRCVKLPRYPGSAWRGAFGHALKKTVCVVRNTPCQQCLLKTACAYTYLFETPPPPTSEKMRKYNAAPHPFVLRFPNEETSNNAQFLLDLTVFGHGQRYFPYFVHALQNAGLEGIGGHRQIFQLQKINEITADEPAKTVYQEGELIPLQAPETPKIPEMPDTIQINFYSPLRIKQDGKNITEKEFNFGVFFSTLLRRISMISYFHTDRPLDVDFAELTKQAKTIELKSKELEWFDWTRYSSRQQTEMNMGGLIGKITLDMKHMEPFWPYLCLGEWTHVGKGTSMGMGAYTLSATSLPNQR